MTPITAGMRLGRTVSHKHGSAGSIPAPATTSLPSAPTLRNTSSAVADGFARPVSLSGAGFSFSSQR